MSAPPYMKLFWGDYHKRTRHLKRDQHGAYFLLIGEAWQLGGALPDDDVKLAAWALCTPEEWAAMKPIIMEFFALRRGKWWHDRVREELATYEATSRKRKEAGKKGGSAKPGKETGNTEANASLLPTKPEPEPEPVIERSPPPPEAGGDDFLFGGLKPERPKRAPRPAKASSVKVEACEEAIRLWNEMAKRNDLVSVRWPINDTRLGKLKKRLEDGGVARWKEALDKVERSRFLCGEGNPRNIGDAPWQAGLDFVLQPSSWDKIHEGSYRQDRVPPQIASDPANWPPERWDRVHTRYRSSGAWPDGAGPKPEEPGYLGPKFYP